MLPSELVVIAYSDKEHGYNMSNDHEELWTGKGSDGQGKLNLKSRDVNVY